jgi:preprotein translocase subunit SecA
MAIETLEKEVERMVAFHTAAEQSSQWEKEKLLIAAQGLLATNADLSEVWPNLREEGEEGEHLAHKRTQIIDALTKLVHARYKQLEEEVGNDVGMAEIERFVLLRSTDDLWVEHLETMEHLRRGINLQAYGQRDPLVEYKREAYQLFQELLANIQFRAAQTLFRIRVAQQIVEETVNQTLPGGSGANLQGSMKG